VIQYQICLSYIPVLKLICSSYSGYFIEKFRSV